MSVPHFWCRNQLLVPGEMLLQGSWILVQVTQRLVWSLVLGGSACCWVQAIGQSQAGSRAPVSPGGKGLVHHQPTLELGPAASPLHRQPDISRDYGDSLSSSGVAVNIGSEGRRKIARGGNHIKYSFPNTL